MVKPRELCHPPTMVALDHALVVRLRPEAARRDVPIVRLIHDLLDTIARRAYNSRARRGHCARRRLEAKALSS